MTMSKNCQLDNLQKSLLHYNKTISLKEEKSEAKHKMRKLQSLRHVLSDTKRFQINPIITLEGWWLFGKRNKDKNRSNVIKRERGEKWLFVN